MLELKTKWMTNTLAKASMLNKDYVLCESGIRLFIVGYGALTSTGKNTYNYELKSEGGVLLASGESAYLDKLTTLIKGASPKANKSESKSKSESAKASKPKTNVNKASKLLTFDDAFLKACKQIEDYKKVAKLLGKYDPKDAITLAMSICKQANEDEKTRIANETKQANILALQASLDIAKKCQNEILIKQLEQMIILEKSM